MKMESALDKGGSVCEIAPLENISANKTIAAADLIRQPPARLPPGREQPKECGSNQILDRRDQTTLAAYELRPPCRQHRALWLRDQVKGGYSRPSKPAEPAPCFRYVHPRPEQCEE